MLVSDFHFHLPPEQIAQHPPTERDGARMLHLHRATGQMADLTFRDLPSLLQPGDLVVLNNSRVIPARLFARRAGLRTQPNSPAPSGTVEVLLTQQLREHEWRALVKPGRKVQPGEVLHFFHEPISADRNEDEKNSVILSGAKDLTASSAETSQGQPLLTATVLGAGERGERTLHFDPVPDFFARLDTLGHIPLPPYLHRADTAADRARYQTVYADPAQPGSAAAPTAGLHFTPEVLSTLQAKGIQTATITLHVGLGTFQPVQVERVEDIHLHAEHYTLSAATADAVNRARREHRRIVAVGTTTVRTLEHCARAAIAAQGADAWRFEPHSGSTSIFLKPGDTFHVVDALLTNFHLPASTLLMLVSAFAAQRSSPAEGIAVTLAAYRHAVAHGYRFFSYGDCMFLD